ncbi:MAG: leucyl aminopeptidase [Pseudomonadota bacterium]|nr:leucyl aminopeptidase [Pseudomonadota bacterium]
MRLTFAAPDFMRSGVLVSFVAAENKLSKTTANLNQLTKGAVKRAIQNSRFNGNFGQTLTLLSPPVLKAGRLLLVGIGKGQKLDLLSAQQLGGTIYNSVSMSGNKSAGVFIEPFRGSKLNSSDMAANIAYGCYLRSYRFDKYRTREKAEDKPSVTNVTLLLEDFVHGQRKFAPMRKVAEGVFLTRNLVSEPANIIYPISFARRVRSLTKLGVKIRVLDEKKMQALGMGALLGVAQGSANSPRIMALQWNGLPKSTMQRPIAFVGKGVTFDTGGISIKPSGGMEDMKWDMAGAGVVAGLLYALAARKAKVNAVGVVGLVENMPSSKAQRPGDVVKTMSGQTIEVINTDAEGRLVLADAMWWCQKNFKPHTMIDLATLTGAIIVSLGHHYAGMFTNNDQLGNFLTTAGEKTNERVWRMPLADEYDKQVASKIADMKNVGGRDAGSITAAQILKRFVLPDVAWAHLDIAGVSWSNTDSKIVPKGGTAFGVRLLNELVKRNYELK